MDFRKKLLVLSASAMAFAGVASAAASTPCPGPANLTGLPNLLRLEGTNDLVTDLDIGCGTGATLTQGTVVVALTGTVTSHQVSKALNEATLRILFGTSSSSTYAGTVSGSQVNFGVVTFPTATSFQMDVANIRVNSSLLSANQYVTETLNVYNKGVLAFSSTTNANAGIAIPVGYVQQGFAAPVITGNGFLGALTAYPLCNTFPSPFGGSPTSFNVAITENFGGAFKTQTPNQLVGLVAETCGAGAAVCTETNGEQGSFQNGTPGLGTANSGTRFLFSFAGVPSGVTIYLPTTVSTSYYAGASHITLTLTASATGAFSPVKAIGVNLLGLPVGDAAISASNGAATAVYEVTQSDNTVPNGTVTISGYYQFAGNFVSVAPATPTLTVTPAPTGSTNVPNFAVSGNPATPLNPFVACTTSLLFPFVTNTLGFDTGIVLANTSTDPFGFLGAAPANGSCALNFYGTGAPTNPVAAPGGLQSTATINAFQLSSVAPGFEGYMIAVCNYNYGHGYAFIEYDLTQTNGIAEGYIPLVITGTRGQATAETLTE